MLEKLLSIPHRRFNPLSGEWVLVSPHRLQRPWQGKVEETAPEDRPQHDPTCYLCPGNPRAGGAQNPDYTDTFVFQNDFAALLPDPEAHEARRDDLLLARAERGLCRVICFSPRHDLTLPEMTEGQVLQVVEVWTKQYLELGAREGIGYVQIFENKGQIMGCSNPHPHGQIWATENVPLEPSKEDERLRRWSDDHNGRCLLCRYTDLESASGERVICANDSWIAVVPFWAKWPFEAMLVSRRHARHLGDLEAGERAGLAEIIKRLTTRYDNLFQVSFPYTMGFHQAPTGPGNHDHWHLHAHFYPPLLRSATVQKFMVGFEMLGTPQRDITPENAAERLRDQSETHYRVVSLQHPGCR